MFVCSLFSLLLNEIPDRSNFRKEGFGLRASAQSTMTRKSQGKSRRKLAITSSQETKRMNVLGLLSLFYSFGDTSPGNGTAYIQGYSSYFSQANLEFLSHGVITDFFHGNPIRLGSDTVIVQVHLDFSK